MTREIKPEDVPAMMRDGRLEFGMELEFSNNDDFADKEYGTLEEFSRIREHCFSSHLSSYRFAKFPLPALRDGDPVWAKTLSGWEKVHFKKYSENSDGIHYYQFNRSGWTNRVSGSYWALEHRIPTQQELKDAGLDPDWFKGRRGVRQ